MQYNRDESGKMTPLPRPSIDTGMGLERITAVMQGVLTNYDTDHFRSIIAGIEELSKNLSRPVAYHANDHTDTSLRVIADHARAMAFLIADGILPSNEGRGYVLRRVMRRAARHSRLLGFEKPVLFQVTECVVDLMAAAFPELVERRAYIAEIIRNEEERFLLTLDNGLRLIHEEIDTHKKEKSPWVMPGDVAFKLYDTYGFPLDLTQTIGRDEGFVVDIEGFEHEMEKQRERARASWKGSGAEAIETVYKEIRNRGIKTEFFGYERLRELGQVRALIVGGDLKEKISGAGAEFQLVSDQTPFYGEIGGQVGDQGVVRSQNANFEAEVTDSTRPMEDLIVLHCKLVKGEIKIGDTVDLRVDEERRGDIARNHSATHLLQASLRKLLGEHIQQKGSLVTPDRLRFDFTHFSPVSDEELLKVETLVNQVIRQNHEISTKHMAYADAVKTGAMALFGEKYGEVVRLVDMGGFSKELCGGTHSSRTGDIGLCKIVSESSVAAGVRRIEALTGRTAVEYIQTQEKLVKDSAALFKASPEELADRVSKLMDENKKLRQDLRQARIGSAGPDLDQLISQAKDIDGMRVLGAVVDLPDQGTLLDFSDRVANKLGKGVLALGSKDDQKAYVVVRVSKDLTSKLNAGKLVSKLSEILGGKGGGKPDLARGGGVKLEKLGEALEEIFTLVKEQSQK
jgi:alanyl-tRNA synthetase